MLDQGRALDDALAATPRFGALAGRDRAFARALVAAALRRLGSIDAALSACLERPLPETAHAARAILRIGAAQLVALGTPAHAAVSEAVADAKAYAPAFAGLINAVLRRLAREGAPASRPGADLPAWLFARWRAAYGDAPAEAIALALQAQPPLDITLRNGDEAAAWVERLGAKRLPTGTLRLPADHGPVPSLPGYGDGAWWVQDAAAALPARVLGEVRGRRVLDVCAAPGGKTLQLAAAGARVTALDIDAQRLARVAENLARCRLQAEILCADARSYEPPAPFDAVLLDAPCTATGTLRRRPDASWLRKPADIPALATLQAELTAAAVRCLAPGGVLVYAVCSLEPEETIAPARAAGVAPDPLSADEAPGLEAALTAAGALRTHPALWPEAGGLDGFFIARARKLP